MAVAASSKYMEIIENAASYNTRLRFERRMRLPFLDSQTGVAQSHSSLFFAHRYRCPGENPGQIYSYPAMRWKKKARSFLLPTQEVHISRAEDVDLGDSDMHAIRAVENPAASQPVIRMETDSEASREKWYDELATLSEPAEPEDDRHSDFSDYDPKKKKRKAPKKSVIGGRTRRSMPLLDCDDKDKEKPYSCDSKPASNEPGSLSRYCDFCLGDEVENKKTGISEELVSCADCGRSGHPTCLQFTANMIISVKKYNWQCIECKSCGLCGTSDNDDQLLFCDDCDRGYHMYCLKPPLTEPPEGSWSCHLCVEEFYGGKKGHSAQ